MSEPHVCELLDCPKFQECVTEPKQCFTYRYYFKMSESLRPILSVRIQPKDLAENQPYLTALT